MSVNGKDFYDSAWHKWSDMKKFGPASRHIRQLCLKMIKDLDWSSILDVGCGEASFLKYLHEVKPDASFSGADIAQFLVEKNSKSMPFSKFYAIDIENSFLGKKYDLVTAIDIIEHVNDDVKFLGNVHRMTKKYLLICTLMGRMRPIEREVGHVRNYSEGELLHKLDIANFDILSIKRWGFPFYSPFYRNVLQHVPESLNMGEFGLFKRAISQLLYGLFMLNLPGRGDCIIVLAKPK